MTRGPWRQVVPPPPDRDRSYQDPPPIRDATRDNPRGIPHNQGDNHPGQRGKSRRRNRRRGQK